MDMPVLYWREATLLWLIALPFLTIVMNHFLQKKRLHKLVDPHMHSWALAPSHKNNRRQILLLSTSWILLITALAGPRTPDGVPALPNNQQAQVMVLIDLSASMQAEDINPSRRSAVLQSFQKWLNNRSQDIDVGIQLFAGNSHTIATPSNDYTTLSYLIQGLESLLLPTLGNDLANAIHDANKLFTTSGEKRFLLFSDGDLGQKAQTLATQAASNYNIPLYVVGVGSDEASPIPNHKGGQIKLNGRNVLSRQQRTWLENLANKNHGKRYDLTTFNQQSIEETLEIAAPKLTQQQVDNTLWKELFGVPLVFAILLILFSLKQEHTLQLKLLFLLCLLPLLTDKNAVANDQASRLTSAYQLLMSGQFKNAQQGYSQAQGYHARFGEASACYRQKNYDCAIKNYAQSIWLTNKQNERARAIFNLANAHYRNADFAQASVLFSDAKKYGIAAKKADLGKSYADSALAALRRYKKELAISIRKAEWRTAAYNNVESNNDSVSQDKWFFTPQNNSAFSLLPVDQQLALLNRALQKENSKNSASRWVQQSTKEARTTSQLLQKLFELEVGIPAHQNEPRSLKGVRQW